MALFGLEESDDYGAQGALSCASRMLEKLEKLNEELSSEMAEPLTMGIGIHTGEAVIGQMGPPKTPVLTALGDAVNTAARLESATKELGKPVVVSRDTLEAAHVSAHPASPGHQSPRPHHFSCRSRAQRTILKSTDQHRRLVTRSVVWHTTTETRVRGQRLNRSRRRRRSSAATAEINDRDKAELFLLARIARQRCVYRAEHGSSSRWFSLRRAHAHRTLAV